MNDITQLSTLYSNAIARAEKAENENRHLQSLNLGAHDVIARIWAIFGTPLYEELRGKSIYDLIQDAVDRAEKAEEALRAGVKVKSLDWELVDDEHWGSTVLGFSYEVRRSLIRDAVRTRMGLPFSSFEDFNGTVDEAKAHCQADYERRILSALILPPPPVRETP